MTARSAWERRTDDDLIEATRHLDDYTDDGKRIIRTEFLRRDLPVPGVLLDLPPEETAAAPALASLGDRFVGQVVDSILAVVVMVASMAPAAISEDIGALTLAGGAMLALFYVLFADAFQNGQSYGKQVMHIAVVDATTGRPCKFRQSFVRNLLLSVLGVFDWIFIFGKKRQRLGDRAANTRVIKTAA